MRELVEIDECVKKTMFEISKLYHAICYMEFYIFFNIRFGNVSVDDLALLINGHTLAADDLQRIMSTN